MKNHTNSTKCHLSKSVPVVVLFIVTATIMSALVITTSGMVLKKLYAKATNSRADILFITLSTSDIGVGVLRIPSYVLFNACESFVKCSTTTYFLSTITYIFPFFSYFVTSIMAIERLLIIKKNHDYRDFVTIGRLKGIVAFWFVLTTVYALLLCYASFKVKHSVLKSVVTYFTFVHLSSIIVLPIVCIAAYTYVLFYVHRQSSTMSSCKVSGSDNNRRLYKAILLLSVFQFIFNIPGTLMVIMWHLRIFTDCNLLPWLDLFWYNQNYLNGVIFLINHRKK